MPLLHVSPELELYKLKRRVTPKPFRSFVEPDAPSTERPYHIKEGSDDEKEWRSKLDEKLLQHEKTVLMYATQDDVDIGGNQKHNYLIDVFNMAYNEHGVVVLTPNVVLSAIQAVVARAVCNNAEKLRHLFVDHEGKKAIVVVLSNPIGEYSLPEFMHMVTEMLKKNIKEDYPLTDTGLSTSTPTTRLANAVQTMATFKKYFSYGGICCCGYRAIRLDGTPEDWVTLDAKFKAARALFAKLGDDDPLIEWFRITQQVMDRFVEMAALPDGSQLPANLVRFVNSAFVKCPMGSGGDYFVSGWLGTSLTPIFDKDGQIVTVGEKGERAFFDSSVPIPDWDDSEYKELDYYSKQDVFVDKVREWSGNFVQNPQSYASSTNQVSFEMNDHGFVSDIALSAGIGAVSVKPCADLHEYAYQMDDTDTMYVHAKNDDGTWKIPDGYTPDKTQRSLSSCRVSKSYTREVAYNEFRPVVTVTMMATYKSKPEVTGECTNDTPRYGVQEWRKVYSHAALFQDKLAD